VTPRRALAMAGGAVAALALVMWGALREPDNDRQALVATTYSSGDNGAKALYLLLEQSQIPVTRLRRLDYDRGDKDLVLWILSAAPLPSSDAGDLLDFVKGGGTLVAPPELAADLLVRSGAAGARVEKSACATPPCALETGWRLELVAAETAAVQRISGAEPAEVFASFGQQPIVARYAIGAGGVVSAGVFELLRNHAIGGGDTGPFWVRLAAALGARHAFDELHTGYGDLNLLTLLWRAPYRWAALDVGFVLCLGAWAFGSRRRRAERDPIPRRRETQDHVQAVADWWGRSGDLGLPLAALLLGLDARAAGRMHAAGGRNFIAWASAVEPALGARAAEAWAEAETLLAKKSPSPRAVVTAAAELCTVERKVFPC
jgi:hypothetical protein